MLTTKEMTALNQCTYENICMRHGHLINESFWMYDILYCDCGAVIGDRNNALEKQHRLWLRTRKRLGLVECKCYHCMGCYGKPDPNKCTGIK
jgi:hypothetical protein